MKPQIVNADDVRDQTKFRKSPATRILESIEGDYLTMRAAAEELDVHVETLRRVCRTSRVKAPSKAAKVGKMVIYLFTPEDLEELKDYFENGGNRSPMEKRLK